MGNIETVLSSSIAAVFFAAFVVAGTQMSSSNYVQLIYSLFVSLCETHSTERRGEPVTFK